LFNVLFVVFVRWLKNGSLAFAEGLACAVGAKANVPFAGWLFLLCLYAAIFSLSYCCSWDFYIDR
jgi:hypothetical protein